jgi:hypothetical protein
MNPGRQISRQEAAVILFRLLDMEEENEKRPADSFKDSEKIASWSKVEVNTTPVPDRNLFLLRLGM